MDCFTRSNNVALACALLVTVVVMIGIVVSVCIKTQDVVYYI